MEELRTELADRTAAKPDYIIEGYRRMALIDSLALVTVDDDRTVEVRAGWEMPEPAYLRPISPKVAYTHYIFRLANYRWDNSCSGLYQLPAVA